MDYVHPTLAFTEEKLGRLTKGTWMSCIKCASIYIYLRGLMHSYVRVRSRQQFVRCSAPLSEKQVRIAKARQPTIWSTGTSKFRPLACRYPQSTLTVIMLCWKLHSWIPPLHYVREVIAAKNSANAACSSTLLLWKWPQYGKIRTYVPFRTYIYTVGLKRDKLNWLSSSVVVGVFYFKQVAIVVIDYLCNVYSLGPHQVYEGTSSDASCCCIHRFKC